MDRFLKNLVVFLGLSLCLYPVFIFVASRFDIVFFGQPKKVMDARSGYGHMWNRLQEAEKASKIDVLLLGSSFSYRGVDTRSFDSLSLSAFNLGSSGQTPIQTGFLLERYLEKFDPKVIVWDIHPTTFSNSGLESFVDISSNYGFHWDLVFQAIQVGKIDAFNSLMLATINGLLGTESDRLQPGDFDEDRYISGGFVEKLDPSFERVKPLGPIDLQPFQYQKREFEELIKRLPNRCVVLVMSPIWAEDYKSMVGLEDFKDFVKKTIQDYENISFVDFNETDGDKFSSLELFYDEFHLNQQGVLIYNKILLQKISPCLKNAKLNAQP